MKRKLCIFSALLTGFFIAACSDNDEIVMDSPKLESESTTEITATAMMPQVSDTRLVLTDKTLATDDSKADKLEVTWKTSGEAFSVLKGEEAVDPVRFSLTTMTADNYTANFTGKIVVDRSNYYAVYPTTNESSVSAKSLALDMTGQSGKLDEMESKVYMYDCKKITGNTVNFQFNHLTFVLRVKLQLEDPTKDVTGTATVEIEDKVDTRSTTDFSEVTLYADKIVTKATVDLTTNEEAKTYTETESVEFMTVSGTYSEGDYVYFCLIPGEYKNLAISAEVDGNVYSAQVELAENFAGFTAEQMYTIDNTELAYDYNVEVKDFMLNDGSLVKPYVMPKYKEKAIGVVAYLYDGSEPESQKVSDYSNGLVMALKNASEGCVWSSVNATLETEYLISDWKNLYESYNGYFLKSKVDEATNKTEFTAVNTAADYGNTVAAPANTSGWYLPSQGEWMLMLSRNGIGACQSVNDNVMTGNSISTASGTLENIVNSLNGYLAPAGKGNYTAFSSSLTTLYYWSSSEYDYGWGWGVNFYSSNQYVNFGSMTDKGGEKYVRSVLAF